MNLFTAFLLFAALAVYVFARPVDVRSKRDSPPGPPDHPPPSPPAEADHIKKRDPGPPVPPLPLPGR
ncbi:hypothetical protein B9Z55_020721 [Caenorhabditis nigoni]|uniref:Uncharacterized protein n=1 Tax=Caenorhabditis nigoni TaxID=1611254 RepID=A0A2G5TNZ7_9PELO|nr:hypothetical protein B9Z55_020721 [Caenorhabditis nigoni]